MKRTAVAEILILVSITLLCGCNLVTTNTVLYKNMDFRSQNQRNRLPSKKTMGWLLNEIWNSGFLERSELIEREILNNQYGVFDKNMYVTHASQRRACYIREENAPDKVMLHRRLFPHWKLLKKGGARFTKVDERIQATLVHELFHDFWYNILDSERRCQFTIEAEAFLNDLDGIKTGEDKILLLRKMGVGNPSVEDFEPFEDIQEIRKKYGEHKFFGTELFSVIADRAFSGEIIIPKQFRVFYENIVSEQSLNGDAVGK